MISSIRENRRIRGEQRTMRDRGDDYSYQNSAPLEFTDSMSDKEHQKHKELWKLRKQRARIRMGILITVFVLITSALLFWLAF